MALLLLEEIFILQNIDALEEAIRIILFPWSIRNYLDFISLVFTVSIYSIVRLQICTANLWVALWSGVKIYEGQLKCAIDAKAIASIDSIRNGDLGSSARRLAFLALTMFSVAIWIPIQEKNKENYQ